MRAKDFIDYLQKFPGDSNGTLTADGKMVEDKESMIENDSRMLIVEEKA